MSRLVTMLPQRCTTVAAIGASTATTIADDTMIEAAGITAIAIGTKVDDS